MSKVKLQAKEVAANAQSDKMQLQYEFSEDFKKELSETTKRSAIQEIPYKLLPSKIVSIIERNNAATKSHKDFLTAGLLAMVSGAIGNQLWFRHYQGYEIDALMWIVLVAPRGEGKSKPLKDMVKPALLRNKALKLKYDALKAEEDDKKNPDYNKIKTEVFRLKDTTIEAIVAIAENSPHGHLLFRDELDGFISNLTRNNTDVTADFLEIWSRDPLDSTRKTDRQWISLPESPYVSIVGTIQNGLVLNLARGKNMENGFFDRWLFCFPDNVEMPLDEINKNLDFSYEDEYLEIINTIFNIPKFGNNERFDGMKNQALVTEKGINFMLGYTNTLKQIRKKVPSDNVKAGMSKIITYYPRLILVMHALRWACGEEKNIAVISQETCEIAAAFTDYFLNNLYKVHNMISDRNPTQKIDGWRKQIYDRLGDVETVKIKDLEKVVSELTKEKALNGISLRSLKHFIQDKNFFEKIQHGEYRKLY